MQLDRRTRWLIAIALGAVAIGVSALVLHRRAAPPGDHTDAPAHEALIGPVVSKQPDQTGLAFLVRRYSEVETACELPPPGYLADWHGRRFLHGESHDAGTGPIASLREQLKPLGTALHFSRPGRTGGPWVALLPEAVGQTESEELISKVARALATSLRAARVRVFVEAWHRALFLPQQPDTVEVFAGLEDPSVYPVARAAWSLLDMMGTGPEPDVRAIEPYLRQALLKGDPAERLMVGHHPTSQQAEQAVVRYAAAWNAMTTGVTGLELTQVRLPAAADYWNTGAWTTVSRMVELHVPANASGYLDDGRLHFVARSMAAVTSRIRTTEYALHVLERLSAEQEHAALIRVGRSQLEPLVSLLSRAGATVLVLLTPKSESWTGQRDRWHCPAPVLAEPHASALGYLRLPGSKAERHELELYQLVPGIGD